MFFKIIENFLTDEEGNELENIYNKEKWQYCQKTYNELSNTIFWIKHVDNNEKILLKIINKLEKITNKKFVLERGYFNGQTYGLDGDWHVDNEKENMYTFLAYMSDIYHFNFKNIGGQTLFMKDNIITSVEPYNNRAVIFDSRIKHRGMAPLTKNILRISFALKLKEIK